jgi:hypothetical protein
MVIENESYWENELRSLGIKCKQRNEFNEKEEKLEALAIAIKKVYFQDYKQIFHYIFYLHGCLDNNSLHIGN